MLIRSGSFTSPRPLEEFDCGSQSTNNVLTSAAASEAARLMAVVVLPTPPFWLATAIMRPIDVLVLRAGYANASAKSMPDSGAIPSNVSRETLHTLPLWDQVKEPVFHVKHIDQTQR